MQKIRIASPCSADWNRMSGDDRLRFCPECQLNVYNFSAMQSGEIEALVSAKTGRLCARFYQRPDGTMLTQDCPVGFRAALLRATRLASASLSAIIALSQINPAKAQVRSSKSLVQIQAVSSELIVEVVDRSGAVITNARIAVTDDGSNAPFETMTGERGRATLSLRSNASYSIKITSLGFASRTLDLQAPFAKFVTVRMELGLIGEVVEVLPHLKEPLAVSESFKMPAPVVLRSIQPPAKRSNALHRFFSKLRRVF
ncbi:MAG TPA: carboxypeptidase-like regulatory domain-containing protein [Candidatus Acidoferrum sp.]|nr:carboxypeptidase-like regulatory domain-containing protein [Candidatus Acidoferrum sp.]